MMLCRRLTQTVWTSKQTKPSSQVSTVTDEKHLNGPRSLILFSKSALWIWKIKVWCWQNKAGAWQSNLTSPWVKYFSSFQSCSAKNLKCAESRCLRAFSVGVLIQLPPPASSPSVCVWSCVCVYKSISVWVRWLKSSDQECRRRGEGTCWTYSRVRAWNHWKASQSRSIQRNDNRYRTNQCVLKLSSDSWRLPPVYQGFLQ